MIKVTRLDGSSVVVNSGHLLLVEQTPDTLLVLTTGYRLVVRESVDEVISRVVAFRRQVAVEIPRSIPSGDGAAPRSHQQVQDDHRLVGDEYAPALVESES